MATKQTSSRQTASSSANTSNSKTRSHHMIPEDLSVSGFTSFLREKAIVGLAVGFVVGTQVQTLVKQLITSFIDPLTQLIGGKGNQSLSNRVFVWHVSRHEALTFGWGIFAFDLIDFFIVLIIIFALIKIFQLDKLDKPKS